MRSPAAIALLAAATLASLRASPLPGQSRSALVVIPTPLLALALNDLEFSMVMPGIPRVVSVNDPVHSGLFEVRGSPEASVRVEFALPGALTATGGASLQVRFGPHDGFADFSRGRPPRGRLFDPHTPVIGTLGPNGRLFLRLGGTALPEALQQGGLYRATISLTVYDLGS